MLLFAPYFRRPILLFAGLGLFFAQALALATRARAENGEGSATRTSHGEYRVARWTDADGLMQLEVTRREHRWLGSDTWNTVLYGRDLDGSGKPDAWFYRNEDGLFVWKDREATTAEGWEVASQILLKDVPKDDRLYVGILLNQVLSHTTLTFGYANSVVDSAVRDELDLVSLQVYVQRLFRADPLNPEIRGLDNLVLRGYDEIIARLGTPAAVHTFSRAAADVGLAYAGSWLFKGLAYLNRSLAVSLARSEALIAGSRLFEKYAAAMTARSETLWIVAKGAGKKVVGGHAAVAVSEWVAKLEAREQVRATLRTAAARSRVAGMVLKAFGTVGQVAGEGVKRSVLVAETQSLQILAEAYERREEIWDPNPIVMTENLFSNDEFIQNFAFMTNETFWMTAISKHLENRGMGIGARVIGCGIFSLIDSVAVNFVLKHSTDPVRSGFDAGWEASIGNFQNLADNVAVDYFGKLGKETSIPGLSKLGYVFAAVDQGAGYLAYAKTAKWVESERPRIRLLLIPVLGKRKLP